jgi:hypothetical protein
MSRSKSPPANLRRSARRQEKAAKAEGISEKLLAQTQKPTRPARPRRPRRPVQEPVRRSDRLRGLPPDPFFPARKKAVAPPAPPPDDSDPESDPEPDKPPSPPAPPSPPTNDNSSEEAQAGDDDPPSSPDGSNDPGDPNPPDPSSSSSSDDSTVTNGQADEKERLDRAFAAGMQEIATFQPPANGRIPKKDKVNINFLIFARQVLDDIEQLDEDDPLRIDKERLLGDAATIHGLLRERDQKLRQREPVDDFIVKGGNSDGQFPSEASSDLYEHWNWLHNYMNNSIVRDFFNRFSHCGTGPAPAGKFYGDARACMQNGVRAARVYSRLADEPPESGQPPARRRRAPTVVPHRPVTRSVSRRQATN